MENNIPFIQQRLAQLNIRGPVTPHQLQQVMASLPKRPRLGAPAHADDRDDYLAAYYALGPRHRQTLNLQPTRTFERIARLEPRPSLAETLGKTPNVVFSLRKTVTNNVTVDTGVVALNDMLPAKPFDPVLRVRLQAIFCRNTNGLLTDGHAGQSREVLSAAMLKIVAATNAVFKTYAGIEFVFYPAADLELVNDTKLNHDFVVPDSEKGKLSQTPPLSQEQMDGLANTHSTTAYRNQYAAKYPDKMVLLFAEGTSYQFDATAQKWVIGGPSGGGFSWEDLDFVKLGAEIGTTDAEAHGWVHGFQAHEMGHFLHLHHTFSENPRFFLTNEEFTDKNTGDIQKLALARKKVRDYLEAHQSEAPNGNVAMLLDGDRDVVSDTPPDEGTHILHFENKIAGTGDVCGTDGSITLTLKDGTKVTYSPDRTLAMSYYKGCFDNTFTAGQAERMRNALVNKNRRRLVKTQLGDTVFPGEYVCACWDPNPNGQVYSWGQDFNALKADVNKFKGQGLFLTWQQAYTKQGVTRYDSIFNPGKIEPVIIWGWTVQDFKTEDLKQQKAGNGLTQFESYLLPDGQVRVNAIWYPSAPASSWIQGFAQVDFEKTLATKVLAKQKLIHLNSWNLPNNGGVRYDAVWVPGVDEQRVFLDMTAGQFQQKYGEMWGIGRKLMSLDAVRVGNDIHYAGIWTKNPNGQYVVWGNTREQVRQAYDEMWNQGMKLRCMSTVLF